MKTKEVSYVKYIKMMENAKTTEEKVEVYLLAEPILGKDALEILVKLSNSKEVLEIYEEKLEQEKQLSYGKVLPQKAKRQGGSGFGNKVKRPQEENVAGLTDEKWEKR